VIEAVAGGVNRCAITMREFNAIERVALRQAQSDGWLTLTAEMRDVLVTHWQRQCASAGRPFTVLRLDPRRASLWFFPSADTVWTERELTFFRDVLANESGVVLTPFGVRAFVTSGHESTVMSRLLGATSAQSIGRTAPRSSLWSGVSGNRRRSSLDPRKHSFHRFSTPVEPGEPRWTQSLGSLCAR
jgi:hypothetical protein